ncbi:TPA: hypothetical protein ROY01_005886 [Bacillus toyonensis]|nr:hypothetical protein [Bacillus toyonensis]
MIKKYLLQTLLVTTIVALAGYTDYVHAKVKDANESYEELRNNVANSYAITEAQAMLVENNGTFTHAILSDRESKMLYKANELNNYRATWDKGLYSSTQASLVKKDNMYYQLVLTRQNKDVPYLVQYQEKNGVLELIESQEYTPSLSEELSIPVFYLYKNPKHTL